MAAFQITNYSRSEVKFSQGNELIYKKAYCSTAVDGDYLIFQSHHAERNLFRQQFKLLYSDCTNPTAASATELKQKVDKIINDYTSPVSIAREYMAFITQEGPAAPSVSYELLNEYDSDLTFVYGEEGVYIASLSGLLLANTRIHIDAHMINPAGQNHGDVIIEFNADGEFTIYSFSESKKLGNNVFSTLFIHITEYN